MANRIVDRPKQHITSPYGKRKLFSKFHKGIDLRTYDDNFKERLEILLPCECIYLRSVYQKKWGFTHVFSPTSGIADEIKFTHITKIDFTVEKVYSAGTFLGKSCLTKYMIKKGYGEHLHFETWKKNEKEKLKHFNPIKFLEYLEIEYD